MDGEADTGAAEGGDGTEGTAVGEVEGGKVMTGWVDAIVGLLLGLLGEGV